MPTSEEPIPLLPDLCRRNLSMLGYSICYMDDNDKIKTWVVINDDEVEKYKRSLVHYSNDPAYGNREYFICKYYNYNERIDQI